MLVSDQISYIKTVFDNEAEIETVVQKYAQQLFGSSIIYLPKARISTAGGHGIIPDGFVIDVVGEEWFIVEVERALHGTWNHIAPQVSKQLAAAETQNTRDIVLRLALNALESDEDLRAMFHASGVTAINMSGKLAAILRNPPTIAIPIDEIPSDLLEWTGTLRSTVKVWVIEKYVSVDRPSVVLYSLPEENAPTVTTKSVRGTSVSTDNSTVSRPFKDLISARLLEEGQPLTIEYTPRGGQRQCFTGFVRTDGIEVDGRTFSPSNASLYSLHKINPSLRSSNGWQTWKTAEGTLLSVLRDRLPVPTIETLPSEEATA